MHNEHPTRANSGVIPASNIYRERAVPRLSRRQACGVLASLLAPLPYGAAAAVSTPTPPPLMLAKSHRPGVPLTDYLVSEKYDGVRGYWDGQRLLTRGGNVIAAPAWFTAGWPATPMEGELSAGRGQFELAVSTVRQSVPVDTAWRALRFMAFDLPAAMPTQGGVFEARLAALQTTVAQLNQPWVQAVAQIRGTTEAALQRQLRSTVAAGGEGLMLHRASARYVAQRSDDLRKLKPQDDAEARVVDHVPGKGKHAGSLGALVLKLPALDGKPAQRFKLGTGLSDAQRRAPPPVGTWVTYRYRGLTSAGVPRFASFVRVAPEPGL
jgi:DNA ligase 1